MNVRELKEPLQVTWNDIILTIDEGEERGYESRYHYAIRNTISRNLKYSHPDRGFETRHGIDPKDGERKFFVRRLTQKEITQQQQSAVSAG